MRIVIEIDGERVTAIGPDAASPAPGDAAAAYGDPLPGPAPPELLERAKKLGALSAGPPQFGRGAALSAAAPVGVEPKPAAVQRQRISAKRKRASTKKGSRRTR
jgi:hypothetical protein